LIFSIRKKIFHSDTENIKVYTLKKKKIVVWKKKKGGEEEKEKHFSAHLAATDEACTE